ncbi:hypothetical protein BGZ83_009901 [Gryganskiella cystojenkinii]|nr:hypothetical protein BGZ83_009901 [Gryganskiella cystojenkinii]
MHLSDAHHDALKAYLTTELALISDADPGMLADYTIALLKHDKNTTELKALCISQLEDFLQQETTPFVDSLFAALQSKSYITDDAVAAEEEDQIPTGPAADRHPQRRDSSARTVEKHARGRSEDSDDEDRSYKHARVREDTQRVNDRRRDYSPSQPSDDNNRPQGSINVNNIDRQGQGRRQHDFNGPNGLPIDDRRGPSRQQGITTAGFNSRQSNNSNSNMNSGGDRGQWNQNQRNNFGGNNNFQDQQHNNNYGGNNFQDQQDQSNGSWRGASNQRGRGGMRGGRGGMQGHGSQDRPKRPRCRDYDEKGFCLRGDACPFDHGDDRIVLDDMPGVPFNMMGGPQGMPPMMMGMNSNRPPFFPGGPNGGMMRHAGFDSANMPDDMALNMAGPEGFAQSGQEGRFSESSRGMRGGRGALRGVRGGRGRGGASNPFTAGRYGGAAAASKTSLVVEHIPDEFNTIDKVNEFFKQFGSLTNIQVDQTAHKALLQYSTNEEAKAAYNSPEVIFGNRFVKVYWQPDDLDAGTFGASQPKPTGQVRPENSAPGGSSRPAPYSQQPPGPSVLMTPERAVELAAERAAAAAKAAENKKTMMEIQRQKEALIQRQMEEQKVILQKLIANKNMSQQDKDEILKGLKNVAMEVTKETMTPLAQAQAAAAAAQAQKQSEHQLEVERLEKERLDRELEDLNGPAGTAEGTTGSATPPASDAAQTTAALKAKLAALQAQAAAMGIDGQGGYGAGRGRGGYVPRGRGRGAPGNIWSRGGGHAVRGGATSSYNRTFRIDNRSTKLSVQNVDVSSKEGLRAHFETFGELESFSMGPDGASATVQYKNRKDAESAMQQGAQVGDAPAPLKLGWISDPAPGSTPASVSSFPAATPFKVAPVTSLPATSATDDSVASAYHEESDDENEERSWKR